MIRLHLEQDDNFVNELSYNIYREDSLIASNIKSTKHTDFNLTEEKACYRIGVVYNNSNILYSEDLCFAIPDSKDEDDNSPIIYPNPTKDYVKIKCKGITNVKVYSITGAILFETNTHNNEIKLDMSKFPKGIYLIHVVTETETKTYKLVRS